MPCSRLALLYVDPGSGALAWQLIVAALLGSVFYLKRFKARLFSFRKKSPQEAEMEPSEAGAGGDR